MYVGQAILRREDEHFHYDENGQFQNALLSDYLHPTLMETPVDIRVGHVETPSPFTEYGIKGGGEGGRMGAPRRRSRRRSRTRSSRSASRWIRCRSRPRCCAA